MEIEPRWALKAPSEKTFLRLHRPEVSLHIINLTAPGSHHFSSTFCALHKANLMHFYVKSSWESDDNHPRVAMCHGKLFLFISPAPLHLWAHYFFTWVHNSSVFLLLPLMLAQNYFMGRFCFVCTVEWEREREEEETLFYNNGFCWMDLNGQKRERKESALYGSFYCTLNLTLSTPSFCILTLFLSQQQRQKNFLTQIVTKV